MCQGFPVHHTMFSQFLQTLLQFSPSPARALYKAGKFSVYYLHRKAVPKLMRILLLLFFLICFVDYCLLCRKSPEEREQSDRDQEDFLRSLR